MAKNISSFKSIWADFSEIKVREWVGEDLSNLSFEMKINLWPTEGRWKESVEASLRWFVNRGALISWCGGELSSPSLDVFCPDCHAGSIYAAYCNSVGFICGSSLNSEYRDVGVVDVEKFMRVLKNNISNDWFLSMRHGQCLPRGRAAVLPAGNNQPRRARRIFLLVVGN